ncbi:MAG: hypothetical protein ACK2UO_05165 [Caldilineaceae bacterium]
MSDTVLFVWGTVAFLVAVGPLAIAAFLDYRDRANKRALDRAAGLGEDVSN